MNFWFGLAKSSFGMGTDDDRYHDSAVDALREQPTVSKGRACAPSQSVEKTFRSPDGLGTSFGLPKPSFGSSSTNQRAATKKYDVDFETSPVFIIVIPCTLHMGVIIVFDWSK
jgi:hypothetical protein